MARPCRCAASLIGREVTHSRTELLTQWLCHADARQVCDLPSTWACYLRSQTAIRKQPALGKSETCRASAWPSHLEWISFLKWDSLEERARRAHLATQLRPSETCRASAWPSHDAQAVLILSLSLPVLTSSPRCDHFPKRDGDQTKYRSLPARSTTSVSGSFS